MSEIPKIPGTDIPADTSTQEGRAYLSGMAEALQAGRCREDVDRAAMARLREYRLSRVMREQRSAWRTEAARARERVLPTRAGSRGGRERRPRLRVQARRSAAKSRGPDDPSPAGDSDAPASRFGQTWARALHLTPAELDVLADHAERRAATLRAERSAA
jgi:hypothetical protein